MLCDSSLVIVDQIDFECVTIVEAETNLPVAGYRYAPQAFHIAFESMEPIARQVQIGGALRPVQVRQHVRNPACLLRGDLA